MAVLDRLGTRDGSAQESVVQSGLIVFVVGTVVPDPPLGVDPVPTAIPIRRCAPVSRAFGDLGGARLDGVPAVDDYFANLDSDTRAVFARIRDIALQIVPDAEEGTSYGMAALLFRGKPLLGFRTAKSHLSIFPFSPQAVDAARDQLAGFVLSKGTVRFTAAVPPPDEAVRAMVRYRRGEIG
jgi:uncharacterized protein YdhG (YjbR/CyaY superfamily)